jgi:hypothetical protein
VAGGDSALRGRQPRIVDYELQITLDRPADIDTVIEFFEGSAYRPEPVDERTIALIPPEDVRIELARREVAIYLRVLERVHQGVGASLEG